MARHSLVWSNVLRKGQFLVKTIGENYNPIEVIPERAEESLLKFTEDRRHWYICMLDFCITFSVTVVCSCNCAAKLVCSWFRFLTFLLDAVIYAGTAQSLNG